MALFSKETGHLSDINRCNSIPAPEQVKFEKEIATLNGGRQTKRMRQTNLKTGLT